MIIFLFFNALSERSIEALEIFIIICITRNNSKTKQSVKPGRKYSALLIPLQTDILYMTLQNTITGRYNPMNKSSNDIRIIFFDIDGTLIDMNKKRISERMLETLIRLKERNILLCLATGRTPLTLPRFEGVEFDAWLTFNGSYCYTREQDIFSNPIPADDVQTIIRNAASIGRPVSIASKNRLTANGKDEDLIAYYSFAKLDVEVTEDFAQVSRGEIFQIMLGCREEDYPRLLKNTHGARITAWWDRAADIIPSGSGKGIGVEKILAHFHLDRAQALAFGDGNNDLEMLQAVGCGVAMGNASAQLKEAADDVCGHVADDGIYHYCAAHGLL